MFVVFMTTNNGADIIYSFRWRGTAVLGQNETYTEIPWQFLEYVTVWGEKQDVFKIL